MGGAAWGGRSSAKYQEYNIVERWQQTSDDDLYCQGGTRINRKIQKKGGRQVSCNNNI